MVATPNTIKMNEAPRKVDLGLRNMVYDKYYICKTLQWHLIFEDYVTIESC